MSDRSDFIAGMRLSDKEISALERQFALIEQATKNRLDFLKSDAVAFTPGAMLVVAVAEFAYRVYQDYGRVALGPERIQSHLKNIAKQLADLEAGGEEALTLDAYARLRRDLLSARTG